MQIFGSSPFAMVLTDPNLPDNPIVFVNDAFEVATGYSRAAAVGRNCRFLQGDSTDPRTIDRLRAAIAAKDEVTVDILNYRADKTPFWNRLMIAPILGDDGNLRFYFGVQKALGRPPEQLIDGVDGTLREIQHRVKNHLMMVVSLIRLQSREADAERGLETLARRVESLQLLYEELNASGGQNRNAVALGGYLTRVVNAVAQLGRSQSILVDLEVESFTVPLECAVRTGLIVSEIVTNAVQHAFDGRPEGRIGLAVHETDANGIRIIVADNGIGIPQDVSWPNPLRLGGRIVEQLCASLGAELTIARSASGGTEVSLEIPASARSTE